MDSSMVSHPNRQISHIWAPRLHNPPRSPINIGYPEGHGKNVLNFLSNHDNLTKLVANLDKLYTSTEEERAGYAAEAEAARDEANLQLDRIDKGETQPTPEHMAQLLAKSTGTLTHTCPSLARETSSGILTIIASADKPVPVQPDLEFIADGVFCEWAYVVDVDAGVLEAYAGGLRAEGWTRFHELECVKGGGRGSEGGWAGGPTMVGKWPLGRLPSEEGFLRDIRRAMEGGAIEGGLGGEDDDVAVPDEDTVVVEKGDCVVEE